MALPNRAECEAFIQACMDPDHLRVLQHLCEERLAMVQQRRSIHERPMIAVAGQESPQGPTAARRQAAANEETDGGKKRSR